MTPEDLIRDHAQAVLSVCLAYARNLHDAEELAQDVLMKAITKLPTVRDPGSIRRWLLQIARRTSFDHLRRRRPIDPLPPETAAAEPVPAWQFEGLHAALARLPDVYREAIVLYYLDGRDCAGTATALGISEVTVRQRLARGRLMLHDLLKEANP